MNPRDRVDRDRREPESGSVYDGDDPRSPADLAGQLRRAFRAGELTAYFQPQYDIKSRRVVALEALCRWVHPEHGVLLPDRFIDVAEQYGLISDLGKVMLDGSGQRVAEWHRQGVNVGLSLNVSPTELVPEFAARILRRLRELELPERAMTIELTESPAITYAYDELATLDALIDGGVGVSIDDFGIGNTSLELIRRLPLTEIKIDKSLVHEDTPAVDDLAEECIEIAHERRARVVAEGIEIQEHFERAARWGCDRAQGYFFSPPRPAEEIDSLLMGEIRDAG